MFEKILIPVDGSPRAEAILRPLARLLRRRAPDIVFLRVLEPVTGYVNMDPAALLEKDRAEAKDYFRELTRGLGAFEGRVITRLREGAPAEAILQAAKDEKATLIAMTTHGRTSLARWALGSVAEKVLRGASVPVLLARSGQTAGAGWTPAHPEESPFRRILMPTDGSEAAEAALPAVAEIARAFDAQVVALNVQVPMTGAELGFGVPPLPTAEPPRTVATALASRLADLQIKTDVVGAFGDPAEKILETAAAMEADLVAMSTHGRTGLARLGLGSVTERVLRASPVPMLVVRAPAPARARSRSTITAV